MATDNITLAAVAGLVTAICTDLSFYPIDILRAKAMGSSFKEDLTKVKTKLFAGYHLQLMQAPIGSLFFVTYQFHRRFLLQYLSQGPSNFLAAALSEVYTCIARNPFDILKQQLQVGRTHSSRIALNTIIRKTGWKGLMTGLLPSMLRDIPFSGVQMICYQKLKKLFAPKLPDWPIFLGLLGVLASVFAGIVTCPFDVLRTKLMSQNFNKPTQAILKEFITKPSEWWRGLRYRCLMLSIGGLSWWYFYQKTLKIMRIYVQQKAYKQQ